MPTPIQLARTFAPSYEASSRKDKGTILDRLTEVTGWTRDHARHQLRSQIRQIRAGVTLADVADRRHDKPKKFSPQAQRALESVWKNSGRPCGKYLEAGMADCIDSMERHGHFRGDDGDYSASVRSELLDISAATIDRYLQAAKADDTNESWLTNTGTSMRAALPRQRMRTLLEPEPGYFIVQVQSITTAAGEVCSTVTFTDVQIGWVQTMTFIPGTVVTEMLAEAVRSIPYVVTGVLLAPPLPTDDIEEWAEDNLIEFHCMSELRQGSRLSEWNFENLGEFSIVAPTSIDHLIAQTNELWMALGDRLNYFMPVKNPVGWRTTPDGDRRRVHDRPATPVSRLVDAGILCTEQTRELREKGRDLDIVALTERVEVLKTLVC